MPTWLEGFVAKHAEAQRAADPRMADVLAQARGMRLFGTIGFEVCLRSDGSTVALVEGTPDKPDWWEEQSDADHVSALVVALKYFPELGQLLPQRASTATDCPACEGTGRLFGLVCGSCSGLGWLRPPAT